VCSFLKKIFPDLDACSAFGETPTEALREVELAKEAWFEAARAEGKAIPNRETARSFIRRPWPAKATKQTTDYTDYTDSTLESV
jgi:hypothetical protein